MDEDLQFVVSVTRAEEPASWDVKVGLEVVGQVVEKDGWTWRRGGLGSEELPDRMTAVLELLQQVQNEFRDADVEEPSENDEAFTLRYTDPTTGRRVVLYRCQLGCTNCGEMLPASQVGMRRIHDGLYRSQPQCSRCRSKKQG